MKLGLIVHCPSPHQKVLLDCLYKVPGVDIVVAYAYPNSPNRNWGTPLADGPTQWVPFESGIGAKQRLRDWVKTEDRDIWVLGSSYSHFRTQLLAAVLGETGRPLVYFGEPPRPRNGYRAVVRDYLLRRVLDRCDGAIGYGAESARRYRALLGNDRPVTSVPYYIPLDEWRLLPLVAEPQANTAIRFLTLAQLIHRKGIDILIEACRALPSSGWTLDVYGEGPERSRLERVAASSHLPITLHRPLAFDRRMEAFAGKHVFVFPTRWDGWGMVLVEALAAGLPVISTDQAMSAHDFIESGKNGWVVSCTAEAIAEAMRSVLVERQHLPRLSQAARESVAKYDPRAGAEELVRFCDALLKTHQTRQKTG